MNSAAVAYNLAERPPYTNEAGELIYLRHENKNLLADNDYLKEIIRLLKKQRFGSKSEIYGKGQGTIFNESECEEANSEAEEHDETSSENKAEVFGPHPLPPPPKKRGKPVRKPLSAHLPRVEKVIDLAESEKFCPLSGLALVRMGEEVSEQLDVVPASLKVLKIIRLKYACTGPCCQASVDQPPVMRTAALEPQPIPKSMAAPGLLAYIATAKYSDALPLYRQEGIFERIGVELPRSTQASWMIACGKLIQPLINLARDELLDSKLIYGDETPVQILKRNGKKATCKSYMWVFMTASPTGPKVILYELGPGRSHEVPLSYLEGYCGYLHTDGYEAYETLAKKVPGITLVGDWVHVRRKFDEAVKAQKNPKGEIKASVALRLINELFRMERELTEAEASDEERLHYRQNNSRLIVEALKTWAGDTMSTLPPKSLTGKAINYMLGQWPKLLHFLNDPILRLDTNLVENAIRPFVVGRKNWLFSNSTAGAEASAALYSLISMAKAQDINPQDYLTAVFAGIPKAKTAADIASLLPWNWQPPVVS